MDTNEYRKRVLAPFKRGRRPELLSALEELRGGAGLPSSLDLVFLYDIAGASTDADHAQQVAAVADCWSKSINNANYRDLAPQLLELHQLLAKANTDLSTAAFWAKAADKRKAAARDQLDAFGKVLKAEYRALGVITPELLRSAAESVGRIDQLSDAELAKAAKKAGVVVVEPFEVPEVELPAALSELQKTRCRSIVDAIYLDQVLKGFTVVDRFHADGAPALTPELVKEGRSKLAQRPSNAHNEGLIKVLGALALHAKTAKDLHAIVLRHLVEEVKDRRSPLAALAVQQLVQAGVDAVDAGRIVLKVGARSQTSGPQTVADRLLEGELREARRIYDLLAGAGDADPELAALGARISAAEETVARLTAEGEEAARRGDIEVATRALTQAVGLAADDDRLAEVLRALPPAAPLNVVVSGVDDSNDVRVLWSAGFGSGPDTRYRVVRKTGSPPRDARDGILLADDLQASELIDVGPPPGVEHWYGVSASRGGSPSAATTARILHLPPVLDLRARAMPTAVVLSWATPPGAAAVEVVQLDEAGRRRPIGVTSAGSAEASGLDTGKPYAFQVTAVFRDATGAQHRAAARAITITPRTPAEPLRMLNVEPVASTTAQLMVRASWRGGSGHDVEIWQFTSPPSFTYGSRVPMSEVRASGTELLGDRVERGERHLVTAPVPPGLRYYLPFTRDDEIGVAGPLTELGLCPPVTQAKATRYGDEVVVSWTWPDESFDVAATWDAAGASGERLLSPSQYRSESGLRIRVGPGPATVRLRTLIKHAADRWSSPEVLVDVPGTSAVVTYEVGWPRKLIGTASQATFSFRSAAPVDMDVVIVAARGRYLPIAPDGAVALKRAHVTVTDPTLPHEIVVPLAGLGKDYWVRAFPTNPSLCRIDDPPSSQLKGR